jgi:hypothetical protein
MVCPSGFHFPSLEKENEQMLLLIGRNDRLLGYKRKMMVYLL